MSENKMLHIAMYPWFAYGHLTAYLHIANKLAMRGHKVSFFLPTKTQPDLLPFNHHPQLITLIPVDVPHVDGLPHGSQTTNDVTIHLQPLIMTAMDHTRPIVESFLIRLKPDLIFFDFAHWVPALSRQLGIKSVHYCIVSAAFIGYLLSPARESICRERLVGSDLLEPPPEFPKSAIKLSPHEAHHLALATMKEFGSGVTFLKRQLTSFMDCDALAFKSCRETEGQFCDYLEVHFGKPVLLAGPVRPEPPTCTLDEKWIQWLDRFEEGSVILCALGSECVLEKGDLKELLLGLEMSGMPFIAALRHDPQTGEEYVNATSNGILTQWVPQNLILRHPSVGCFVTHCGSGSLSEAMTGRCQMVFFPRFGDQFFNARFMAGDLGVGVEIERGQEDGSFTRESVCKAIKCVMDENGELGKRVRANSLRWRDFFTRDGVDESYINEFVGKLRAMSELPTEL